MTDLLAQVQRALTADVPQQTLRCENQLRAAASTLSRAPRGDVAAATVVAVLGADDVDALETLLTSICDEHHLDAMLRRYVGSFSVRFTRRAGD